MSQVIFYMVQGPYFGFKFPLMKRVLLFVLLAGVPFSGSAQQIEWQKCLGGQLTDVARSVRQTPDGGFVVAGSTGSNDGDVSGNHGTNDYWLAKTDSNGVIGWQRCLGGSGQDFANAVALTAGGGYVVAGYSGSNDSNVTGNHGGGGDFWVVQLDGNGNIGWQKCLGGTQFDNANSVQATSDGGFIVCGNTQSDDGDVSGNHGGNDCWVVKLDGGGNIVWQKCLGGTFDEQANAVWQNADGGYIIAGYTESNDGDVSGSHGSGDIWVVRLDSVGSIVWQKCLGGTGHEIAYGVRQTPDGGFIVISETSSDDGDVSGNHGIHDFWVIRLDGGGTITWSKCLGGTMNDSGYSLALTSDGGFVFAGVTESNDGDVSGNHGSGDVWTVKLDSAGNMKGQRCLGGTMDESANALQATPGGGFVVAGRTDSNDGDVSGNHGGLDFWVVRLDGTVNTSVFNGASPVDALTLSPNPARERLAVRTSERILQAVVYDLAGMPVLQQDFALLPSTQQEMDLSSLAAGIYIVRVRTGRFTASGKVMKAD